MVGEFYLGLFLGIMIACVVHRAHKYEKKIGHWVRLKRGVKREIFNIIRKGNKKYAVQ